MPGEEERAAAAEADELGERVRTGLLYLPNIPADETPDGLDEEHNVEIRRWWPGQDLGRPEPERLDHQSVPHWEIGEALQILDMERGARLSGSMFPLYRGPGARLLRALTAFAIDHHSPAYEEIRPPTVVLTETITSTGHLPKFADDAYHVERDDLWLIPTAEVPLTSLHRGEILEESQLPMRFTAATPCYRREAGSAGRDTRGLLRVHEFDKVELFAYATPERALDAQADILRRAESLLQELELPYRVLDLCAGDLGGASARTFDLEAYSPGVDRWLEVSSVSWYRDYQARRANVRYRPAGGGPLQLVHTVNGSALAWPRMWAALVENGRQEDGTVLLPEALAPYVGRRAPDKGAVSGGGPAAGAAGLRLRRAGSRPSPPRAGGCPTWWRPSTSRPASRRARSGRCATWRTTSARCSGTGARTSPPRTRTSARAAS